MRHIPEYYPRKQAIPRPRPQYDLATGRSNALDQYTILKEEYMALEKTVDKLLNEQIQKTTEVLVALEQMKLHLADISDEDVDQEDVEVE